MRALLRSFYRRVQCAWRPRVLILVYHCVCPPGHTDPYITVSPEHFEEQIAYLGRTGMAISMDELLGYIRGTHVPKGGRILVTMDDADEGTATYAAPVLRRYGVPATVFVPTGAVGLTVGYWWHRFQFLAEAIKARGGSLHEWLMQRDPQLTTADPFRNLWKQFRLLSPNNRDDLLESASKAYGNPELPKISRPLNWDELDEMSRDGLITLGAHTVTHPMMAKLTDDELNWEVQKSREQLSTLPGYRDVFAYPYGDPDVVNDRTITAVRNAGFTAAFINTPGTIGASTDRWALPRVGIDDVGTEGFRWAIDRGLTLVPSQRGRI